MLTKDSEAVKRVFCTGQSWLIAENRRDYKYNAIISSSCTTR